METEPAPPPPPHRRRALALLAEAAFHAACVALFLWAGGLRPTAEGARLFPLPDAPEHAWASLAWAGEAPFLLPIANEWHPTRYAPVHGMASAPWVGMRGGGLGAAREWPAVALALSAALLAVAATLAGGGAVGRCLVVMALATSPQAARLAGLVMQEPSFLVLFGACLVAFAGALRAGDERPGARRALLVASGLLAGVLILGRGTLLGLGPALALGLAVAAPRRQWLGGWAALLAGAIAGAGLLVVATRLSLGMWRLEGYLHWMPDFDPFGWAVAMEPPRNLWHLEIPQAWLIAREHLGLSAELVAAGPALVALLLAALASWAAPERLAARAGLPVGECPAAARGLVVACLLTWLSVAVFQAFYFFHDPRFHLLPWMALAMAGAIAAGRLARRGEGLPFAVRLGAGVLLLAAAMMALRWAGEARRRTDAEALPDIAALRAVGDTLRGQAAPLFLDGQPVVNFRLLAGLADWPWPVSPLTPARDIGVDGHVVQFLWFDVAPPEGHLVDPAGWPADPAATWLADPDAGIVQGDLPGLLARRHGAVLVLLGEDRAAALEPLLAQAAGGLAREQLPAAPGWRLERWTPPPPIVLP